MERILIGFAITILVLSVSAFAVTNDCVNKNYLLLELSYESRTVTLDGYTLENGCPSGILKKGDFKVEVLQNNEIVYTSSFDPSIIFTDIGGKDNMVSGGAKGIDKQKFYLNVPAVQQGQIQIYNKNVPILKADFDVKQEVVRSKSGSLFDWVNNLIEEVNHLLGKVS
ncbi:MAG TPA: hypothetical protein VJH20_02055 [Candidatus Nanoarchaeia archaeon]|nr:hypothetical protein [Candidatus Nanoarchaeia archaeon]